MFRVKPFVCVCCLLLGASATPRAFGDVVLIVDISDTSNVTFTATPALSAVTDSGTSIGVGLTLEDLFAADFDANSAFSSSTLSPSGSSEVLNRFINDFQGVGPTDLNIYNTGDTGTMAFDTATQPLTGSATTAVLAAATFRPVGSLGDIFVGDGNTGSGAVIGQYQITAIPEPSAFLFMFIAAIGMVGLLRGRNRSLEIA